MTSECPNHDLTTFSHQKKKLSEKIRVNPNVIFMGPVGPYESSSEVC